MTNKQHARNGFTLIEVLVALALMALIATILISALSIGGRAWQRVNRMAMEVEDVTYTQRYLRQTLQSLYPYGPTQSLTTPPLISLHGTSLQFSAPGPVSYENGLLRYEISATPQSDLLITWSNDTDSSNSQPHSEILLHGIKRFEVAFLEKNNTSVHWLDYWNSTLGMPALIRINVIFTDGDKRIWPMLYVTPHVDTDANCLFDLISRRCRRFS